MIGYANVRERDELEIRNLLARIAQLADEGELDSYLALFTEDATWGGAGFPERRGRAEIGAGARERRAAGGAGPGTDTRHAVTTCVVDVSGDTARSRSVFQFYANTRATPSLERMGVWEDEFRRTPEGWKLCRRVISG